jgi:hypothetical protein
VERRRRWLYWGSVNLFMNHDEISYLEVIFTVVVALLRKSEKKIIIKELRT